MNEITLIRSNDVIKYGPESDNFPPAVIQPHIFNREQTVARTVLGYDFYQTLLNDIDLTIWNAPDWQNGDTIALDGVVYFYGSYWKSKIADNTTQPGSSSTNWLNVSRFSTPEYTRFWRNYLRNYLSFLITADCLPYLNAVSAKGLTFNTGDESGVRGATAAETEHRSKKIHADAKKILQNLVFHILLEYHNNDKETEFEDCLIIANCKKIGVSLRPGRRWNFRAGYTTEVLKSQQQLTTFVAGDNYKYLINEAGKILVDETGEIQ